MQSLSGLLKKRREDLNFSLETVSEQTKIRIEYLRDLEEGRYDDFPSEVYLKGFLKTYSRFLNLDNSLVQALYRREQLVREKKRPIESISKQFQEPEVIITRKRLIIFFICILLIGIFIFAFSEFTKLSKVPDLSISEPVVSNQNDKEVVFSTANDSINIAGQAELGSTVTINGQKVVLNQLNEFRIDSYKLDKDKMTLIIKSENQFGKSSEIDLNIFKKPPEQIVTASTSSQDINSVGIKLEVLQDTSLKLTVDGDIKVSRNVVAGTIFDQTTRPDLNLLATSKIELIVTKGTSVNVYLNGTKYIANDGLTTWSITSGKIQQQ